MAVNYYAILGVPENATDEEIHKAYRKLAAICHPDKTGGIRHLFNIVQKAEETLRNPLSRKKYESILSRLNESDNAYKSKKYDEMLEIVEIALRLEKVTEKELMEFLLNESKKTKQYSPSWYNNSKVRCTYCDGYGWDPDTGETNSCKYCKGLGYVRRRFE